MASYTKQSWSDFFYAEKLSKLFSLVIAFSQSSFSTSLVCLAMPLQLPQLPSLTGPPSDLVKFISRQHHTCHACPKLAPQHFHKVWENKWWTSTLLIVANLPSQLALELARSRHLRAGLHPSSSLVRLLDSRTRCAKMLSERGAFYPTVVMVLWDVQ